jgi:hypothetical protein
MEGGEAHVIPLPISRRSRRRTPVVGCPTYAGGNVVGAYETGARLVGETVVGLMFDVGAAVTGANVAGATVVGVIVAGANVAATAEIDGEAVGDVVGG